MFHSYMMCCYHDTWTILWKAKLVAAQNQFCLVKLPDAAALEVYVYIIVAICPEIDI